MKRPGRQKRESPRQPPKPYHLVSDRKGRRTILCAIGDCVELFSEIPAFNIHIAGLHGHDQVADGEILSAWRSMTGSCQRTHRKEIPRHDRVGHCQEFIRLWGTLAARWRISKKRKYKRLMDRAMEFSEKRRVITRCSTTTRLEEQVRKTYRLWKNHAKPSILAQLRANLMDTLVRKYELTEDEAVVQGGLDDDIIDSSDEDE